MSRNDWIGRVASLGLAPPARERINGWKRGATFSFTLEAGVPLLEARAPWFCSGRFRQWCVERERRGTRPFGYVMPAFVKNQRARSLLQRHVSAEGIARPKLIAEGGLASATARVPSLQLWTSDEVFTGGTSCRRRVPVAEPFEVAAYGLDGAVFLAEPDPETHAGCSDRSARQPVPGRQAAPLRCGCGERVLPVRWNSSAAGTVCGPVWRRPVRYRRALRQLVKTSCRFATELAVRSGNVAARADGTLEARSISTR